MPRQHISPALRFLIAERVHRCCEYCLLHEDDSPDTNQVDHVIPVKHGGQTASENLAYACAACNCFKGTDFAARDRISEETVLLFNPRIQTWREHFTLGGARIVALTATGRVTIDLLRLNTAHACLNARH